MPSLYRASSNVQISWLRNTRENRPDDLTILNALCLHIKLLRAQRRNTGNPWDYGQATINIKPGTDTYEIPDNTFGKPLAVLTIDPVNPNHIQRRIPFYSPQNLTFNWGWPMDIGAWIVNYDGSVHSAERVAYFWQAGVPFLQFQPIPQLACQYLVLFQVGSSVDEQSLTDETNLGEVGNVLVELRAARTVLPSAEWEDDHQQNHERRKELALALSADIELAEKQFLSESLVTEDTTHGRQWSPLDLY